MNDLIKEYLIESRVIWKRILVHNLQCE